MTALTSQGCNLGRGIHEGLVRREVPPVDLTTRRDVQQYQLAAPKHGYVLIVVERTCGKFDLVGRHTSGLHKLTDVRKQEGTRRAGGYG